MDNDLNNLNNETQNSQTVQKLNDIAGKNHNSAFGNTSSRFRHTPFSKSGLGLQKPNNDLMKNKQGQNHQRPNLGVPTKSDSSNANGAIKSNPGGIPKSDVGSRNLRSSLANKASKALKNRKKKKNNDSSDASSSSDNKNDNVTESNGDNSETSVKDDLKVLRKRIRMIKIISIGLGLFAFVFFLLAIAQIISGGSALQYTPVDTSHSYGTDEFEPLTDKDSSYHNDEINFYKKLKELDDGSININYVNALVTSVYYEDDFELTDEELLENTGGFDFVKMTEMAEKFAKIIKDIDSDDYAINGEIFNELINNSTFRDYYKDVVKTSTYNEVLIRVFEMAQDLDASEIIDDTAITQETKVTIIETMDETLSKPEKKTLSMNEYLADSIYAASNSLENSEVVKAYTVALSTNIVAQNKKLSIDSSTATASNDLCSVTLGCSYDENDNLVSGGSDQSSKNSIFYNGDYYYKRPLGSTEITNLNSAVNSVFGNVLVNSDGTYPVLDIGKINGLGDGYKAILNGSYGNLTYKNVGEDSYILDGSYGTEKVQTSVTFYDQNDYGSYNFCGKKKETIKTSGCGTTSMAIIVSTYENNSKYDPVMMMGEARKTGYCGGGITGTSPGFFKKEANTMKYKYYKASKYSKKDLNFVLKNLSEGNLVIAHMGPGHFTSGGHYMVLGGVDPSTKKVYVYDPYNKVNKSYRKTGNGWYSFNNIIVKEAWNFYVIWKG